MADPPAVLTLLVKKGPCEGKTLQGRAGAAALRVGRVAKGNDLALRDAGASQAHLSVEFLPPPAGRWVVTDLGSSNGTLLNGAPLVPTVPSPLSDGDLIKIGESTVLAVSISADAGTGPAPAATRRSTRNAAAAAAAAEEEQAPAVTRRAGRRKVSTAEAPEAGNEVKEEAAVPTRRGGRKKVVEPPELETEQEEEEEEAAMPRRGRTRKAAATAALPPQPPNTRSARPAAKKGEVVGCEDVEAKVVRTGRGGGRVTRARARKANNAAPEEEEEGEVAVARDQEGTAAKGDEEEDTVETRDGTSNASEVVPAAGRGRAKRSRGGRGRATRASTRKAEDAIIVIDGDEQEERHMSGARELRGSPLKVMATNEGGEEDKVATVDDKLDATSKASMESCLLAPEMQTERAIEGRLNAQHAPADNSGVEDEDVKNSNRIGETEVHRELKEKVMPESKLDGVGETKEDDMREAIGAGGEEGRVGECTRRCSLENMTLGQWFVQIEKYLLAKNEEAAEKAIAEVREKHQWFSEHLKTLKKSSAPS